MTTPLTGTTSNGVPYLAVPPASSTAVMKLLATDAPGLVHGPLHSQAAQLPLWLVKPATTSATNETPWPMARA